MELLTQNPVERMLLSRAELADRLDRLDQLSTLLTKLRYIYSHFRVNIDDITPELSSNFKVLWGINHGYLGPTIQVIEEHLRMQESQLQTFQGARSKRTVIEDHNESPKRVLKNASSARLGFVDLHYAEIHPDAAGSNIRASLERQPSSDASHEIIPSPKASHSESVPGAKKPRRRGDPHRCEVCSKTFTRGTTLREHARTHTNERPYKCSKCEKRFARLKDCRRHELLHVSDEKFHCGSCYYGGCHQGFARMDALRKHLKSGKGAHCLKVLFTSEKNALMEFVDTNKFVCGGIVLGHCKGWGCYREFETAKALLNHVRSGSNDWCFRGASDSMKQLIIEPMIEDGRLAHVCHRNYSGYGSQFGNRTDLRAHVDAPFQSHCMKQKLISDFLTRAVDGQFSQLS
ncbi:hypothetical protein DSL72_003538 [Monilinia vaccinii-corymbosi]|uniref:C2H2-type domain-containing protein n=1 Tax=Monilinia vaccinii-corymbosi TaxID=61207 RepID=A0A8A3P625_9HELO|nr:hypothetical protein DSL72_003538 [Monilinia vaccinii-corymbosi]